LQSRFTVKRQKLKIDANRFRLQNRHRRSAIDGGEYSEK